MILLKIATYLLIEEKLTKTLCVHNCGTEYLAISSFRDETKTVVGDDFARIYIRKKKNIANTANRGNLPR